MKKVSIKIDPMLLFSRTAVEGGTFPAIMHINDI